jgi:hypothetical protein
VSGLPGPDELHAANERAVALLAAMLERKNDLSLLPPLLMEATADAFASITALVGLADILLRNYARDTDVSPQDVLARLGRAVQHRNLPGEPGGGSTA